MPTSAVTSHRSPRPRLAWELPAARGLPGVARGPLLAASVTPQATAEDGPLARLLLDDGALVPVFQPIAALRDGGIHAHEALIRGPQGTPLHTPDALLTAARAEGLLIAFEMQCVRAALRRWSRLRQPGRLFVNISAHALVAALRDQSADTMLAQLQPLGLVPRMLVLELTEHDHVADIDALGAVLKPLRAAGVGLALDDFGDGRSSLRLWSQLRPDIVKIDKYFTRRVATEADKLLTLRALLQIAQTFGTQLVAEGIEQPDDARVIRDLGIAFGQGWFLGRPADEPRERIEPAALELLADTRVAVFPEQSRPALGAAHLRGLAVLEAPTATPQTTNDEAAALFLARPELHAIAIVDDDRRPLAILNRQAFMNLLAKPYFKEIHGRRPCLLQANTSPRRVERDDEVDQLVGILTSQDQRYLSDGFIVTDNGRYVGLGKGEQLVRLVTEARIEAARHANPLTFLPGNIPISQHLQRLLERGAPFVACYADLNNFKPFNDRYGYWRGDEMIRLLARLATLHCDPQRDFVGHVGGDDFLLVFQSADWHSRCEALVTDFDAQARELYDDEARTAGGIDAEDRHGVMRFFACTTLSIGAVPVRPGRFRRPEDVANEAALAKQGAKRNGQGLHVRLAPRE
jgi:diguanylate cyclase (GGDEF)-like protein